MPRVLLGLLILAAAPSLTERKRAADAWAAKHGAVKILDGKLDDEGCLTLRAPASARCDQTLRACVNEASMGSCSGFGSSEKSVVFGNEEGGVMLELVSGDEYPEGECSYEQFTNFGPADASARKRSDDAEYAKCIAMAKKRQEAERVVRHCKVLTVDPCRKEAFVRCTGRNTDGAAPPLGKTLRYSWAKTDAGTPEGGEWETQDESQ